MHKHPRTTPARLIRDSHGSFVGLLEGFRPDPITGRLGLDVALLQDAIEAMETRRSSLWMDEGAVFAIRRDEIVLDLSLKEMRRLLRDAEQRHASKPAKAPTLVQEAEARPRVAHA